MNLKFDIKEIEYKIDEYDTTNLKLSISGKSIDYSIINSLRKVCINQIPTYAFHPIKINILRNSSVYDNSTMKERLSQIPIKRIAHDVKFLALKFYKDVNFADTKIDKHTDDIYEIDIYIKAKNTTPSKTLNVLMSDVKISVNNEQIDNSTLYKSAHSILIIQLRPGEEFECSMKSVLAVGELDGIFNASNAYYKEITPSHYYFTLESSGQLNEYNLLTRGIDIILEKFKIIKENIIQNQYMIVITNNNSLILEMYNEDHTCGGPMNYVLQNMDEVIFSGVNKPDFMQKVIQITLMVKSSHKPFDILTKALDTCIEYYIKLKEGIVKAKK